MILTRIFFDNKIDINSIDAFSGRGGSLEPCLGGTYLINDLMFSFML